MGIFAVREQFVGQTEYLLTLWGLILSKLCTIGSYLTDNKFVTVIMTNGLLLMTEIIALYCKRCRKCINVL